MVPGAVCRVDAICRATQVCGSPTTVARAVKNIIEESLGLAVVGCFIVWNRRSTLQRADLVISLWIGVL